MPLDCGYANHKLDVLAITTLTLSSKKKEKRKRKTNFHFFYCNYINIYITSIIIHWVKVIFVCLYSANNLYFYIYNVKKK